MGDAGILAPRVLVEAGWSKWVLGKRNRSHLIFPPNHCLSRGEGEGMLKQRKGSIWKSAVSLCHLQCVVGWRVGGGHLTSLDPASISSDLTHPSGGAAQAGMPTPPGRPGVLDGQGTRVCGVWSAAMVRMCTVGPGYSLHHVPAPFPLVS